MVGAAIAVLGFVLQVIGAIGLFGFEYIRIMQRVIFVGAGIAAVGLVGTIIGGRHGRVRAPKA
jgi:hypothetical protein